MDVPKNDLIRRCCLIHFEKEFDLPVTSIEIDHGESGKVEVIGQEGELLSSFWIPVTDSPELIGILL